MQTFVLALASIIAIAAGVTIVTRDPAPELYRCEFNGVMLTLDKALLEQRSPLLFGTTDSGRQVAIGYSEPARCERVYE